MAYKVNYRLTLTLPARLTVAFLSFFADASAQVPQGLSYQAVVRDNSGQPVSNRSVRYRIGVILDSMNATSVYTETHQVTSNSQGVVNLVIGGGTSSSGNYATIPWNRGKAFVKLEVDLSGGTNYSLVGTSQLLTVPFAHYSAESGISRINLDSYVRISKDFETVNLEVNKRYFVNANNVTLVLPSYPSSPVNLGKDYMEVYVMQHRDNPRTITLDFRNSLPVGVLDINNKYLGIGVNPPNTMTGSFQSGVNRIINIGDFWMCAGFTAK
jgi:hypothetical protein